MAHHLPRALAVAVQRVLRLFRRGRYKTVNPNTNLLYVYIAKSIQLGAPGEVYTHTAWPGTIQVTSEMPVIMPIYL